MDKYREVSIEGCQLIGKGAKGKVYRYDDELILKLYNENKQYKDIESENNIARQAFIAGIPTAISFGVVKVGSQYGSMFELLDSNTVSAMIAANPSKVDEYACVMADIAKTIHQINASSFINIPNYIDEVYAWIDGGIAKVNDEMARIVREMVDELPDNNTLIHGDLHTGNVMSNRGELMLIDMDRFSICHPIVELSGVYMFYVAFGELDKSMVEDYMGFSYETSLKFFDCFMKAYLETDDIDTVVNKAALLSYVRLVRRCYKGGMNLSEDIIKTRDYYISKISKLLGEVKELEYRKK